MERLDLSYEIAYMATAGEEYCTNMLDFILDHNDRRGTPFPSKKLQETVSIVTAETEEEEKYSIPNVNNVTMDNVFQAPFTINKQRKDENVKNERRIALDIHAETIK